MATIFLFSSEQASESTKTSKVVAKEVISVVIIEDKSDGKSIDKFISKNINVIRKIAHLTEFAILGFFLVNIFKDYKSINFKVILFCVLCAGVYACTDEFHQTLVAGRSGQITDVFIDSAGAFLGALIYYAIYKIVKRKNVVKNY